jgi:tetratricopeptide (TPR) repeat protein
VFSIIDESEQAIENYRKAVEIDKSNPLYLANIGIEYQRNFQFDSSMFYYIWALEIDSAASTVLFNRGLLFYLINEPEKGDEDILKSIRQNPVLLKYLDIEIHRYKLGNSLTTADRLLGLINLAYPDEAAFFAERGELCSFLRENQRAIDYYSTAISLQPDNANWHFARGKLFFIEQNFEMALDDFTKYIEKIPDNPDVYLKRGYTFYRLNKTNEAGSDWKTAVQLGEQKGNEYIETYLKE